MCLELKIIFFSYLVPNARDRQPCARCVGFSSCLARITVFWKFLTGFDVLKLHLQAAGRSSESKWLAFLGRIYLPWNNAVRLLLLCYHLYMNVFVGN